jgi:UDP-glucuronate decarboxylase
MITTTMRDDFSLLAADAESYACFQGKHLYITGATGQIAWYLIRLLSFLIDSGKLDCQLSAHVRSHARLSEKYPDHAALRCQFLVEEDAASYLKTARCDMVIHCASKASPKHFSKTPADVMEVNGILTQRLLEQLRINNPACRFVYLSTTGVTGFIPDEQRPSSEADFGPLSCTDLENCYLESKRFGEMLCLAYLRQYDIPTLIVRPSITYGPGFDLDDGRSYADFVRCLLSETPIKLTSDGSAIRNFLYISDFISGLLLIISKAAPGSVYNIASPYPVSILELATQLNHSALDKSLGPVVHAQSDSATMSRVNFRSTDASVDKLIELGWQQKTPVLEGFKKTILHYSEQQS